MLRLCALAAAAAIGQLASAALAVEPAVLEAQQNRIETIQRLAPAVVAIFGSGAEGGGSGVLIDAQGYALTNFHVVSGAGTFMKCGLNDGILYDAVIVGIDPTGDVAMIKLLGRNDFPAAELGDSDDLRVGDWTYVMGNPFLLATDFQPTVTYGIVSGVHRYQYPAGTFLEYTDCIQVDTSINPGNSGGPLFDAGGTLVGINGRASFEKRGRVNSGAGYAISINQIKNFMDHLRSGRIVDHGTLDATVATRYDGSVAVDSILENSEAYRRGLRVGDEVVSFAGRPIRSVNQFKNILGIFPKGWKMPIVYRREGEKYEIFVRLSALHRPSEITPRRRMPRRPRPEKPGEEKPEDKQPDKPHDYPHPFRPASPAPEEYEHMFVPRAGFANYYFNQLEQQRALAGLDELGDFSHVLGTWTLAGRTQTGDRFEFVIADAGVGLELGTTPYYVAAGQEPVDEPPKSGGLLLAMQHLQLLLTHQGEAFSEFYYLGSEALDGRGERVDVIVSLLGGVGSRWYFAQTDGKFVGFDTRISEGADACEVRFGELTSFDGRSLPSRLRVVHAGDVFATFRVETAELAARPADSGDEDPAPTTD